jgi:hypothetical protein
MIAQCMACFFQRGGKDSGPSSLYFSAIRRLPFLPCACMRVSAWGEQSSYL